jgi:glycosyltransferase involved in cell wall biosynthesis
MYIPSTAARLKAGGTETAVIGRKGSPLLLDAAARGITALPLSGPLLTPSMLSALPFAPDILHLHRTTDLSFTVPVLISRRRPAVVLHRHIGASAPKSDPWHKFLFSKVDRVIAITYYIASQIRQGYAIPPDRVVALHYGLDQATYLPGAHRGELRSELGLASERLIGCAGRLDPLKGQRLLVRAMPEILRRVSGARLLLIGEETRNEPGELAVLRSMVAQRGLGDKVLFLGFRADIPRVLDDLDLLVMPSLREAFGLVALEAMAMGKPVIATRSRGVPEIVHDGETGLLVPPDRDGPLGEAVAELLEDPARAEVMGKNGRELFLGSFTIERHIERLARIYHETAARRL